jgi:hypothetical protein
MKEYLSKKNFISHRAAFETLELGNSVLAERPLSPSFVGVPSLTFLEKNHIDHR